MFHFETIEQRMAARDGRTAGFDYLRILLAVSVVVFHSVITSYGPGQDRFLAEGWLRPLTTAILPMFFALSGFLVAGSLDRSKNLVDYAALRVLRIAPALFVEVCVAALVLGPLMTALPLHEYVASSRFYAYFLNTLGHIHYQLPGLFLDNPDADMVNRQLWTIPGELKCYLVLLLLALLGLTRRRWVLAGFVTLCMIAFPFYDLFVKHEDVRALNTVTLNSLVLAFVCGVLVHAFRDRLKVSAASIFVSVAVCYVLLWFPDMQYIAMAPVAYMTVAIGVSDLAPSPLSRAGDLSYGLYLYGYPLQQTYSHLFPDHRSPLPNIAFALVAGGVLAALSWRFVEKPVLMRRKVVLGFLESVLHAGGRAAAIGKPR